MKNLTELIAKYGDKEIDEKKFKELFDIKDSKVFIPKYGERYWFAREDGGVSDFFFDDDYTDNEILKHTEVYRTEKEAKFARDKRAFKVKMKRDFSENSDEIDWGNGNQVKYFLYFNHMYEDIRIDWRRVYRFEGTLYTTNEEWLKQYIKDNEANIKKYVFEIKEDE